MDQDFLINDTQIHYPVDRIQKIYYFSKLKNISYV